MNDITIIRNEVIKILDFDNSGHGMEHVYRVTSMAIDIAKIEKADIKIVSAIALLHDVDDYKLFGIEHEAELPNAKMILDKTSFNEEDKNLVFEGIKTIGYSKRLNGIIPNTIEAKVVSDADMLDAMGANGLLRIYQYNNNCNRPFFDKGIYPNLDMDSKTYKTRTDGTAINHIFEKILRLKDLMLTESGKKESLIRHQFIIDFLEEYFREENVPEWIDYLHRYVKKK